MVIFLKRVNNGLNGHGKKKKKKLLGGVGVGGGLIPNWDSVSVCLIQLI